MLVGKKISFECGIRLGVWCAFACQYSRAQGRETVIRVFGGRGGASSIFFRAMVLNQNEFSYMCRYMGAMRVQGFSFCRGAQAAT